MSRILSRGGVVHTPLGRHPSPQGRHSSGRHPPARHSSGRHPPARQLLKADTPLGRHPPGIPPPIRRPLQRTVRILLERILVFNNYISLVNSPVSAKELHLNRFYEDVDDDSLSEFYPLNTATVSVRPVEDHNI